MATTSQTEQFAVRNRWTDRVQFTAEITCSADAPLGIKIGLAVRWARKADAVLRGAVLSGADLRGAVLSGAVLSDADLRDADLRGAVLRGADLSGAVLRDADLSDADLRGADLSGADLRDADLRDADLRDADLRGAVLRGAVLSDADLRDADLRGAVLRGADLSGAVLRDADLRDADLRGAVLSGAVLRDAVLSGAVLRSFKADLWMTLTQHAHEVPGLIAALREGRVDGSTYTGTCACLVGTLAHVAQADVDAYAPDKNANHPAEQWFMMIRAGDKPGDDSAGGFASATALEWVLEWCELSGVDPDQVAGQPT